MSGLFGRRPDCRYMSLRVTPARLPHPSVTPTVKTPKNLLFRHLVDLAVVYQDEAVAAQAGATARRA